MNKEKYFICLLPPDELSQEIAACRKKYLPAINLKDEHKKFPHLTLQHTFSRTADIEQPLSKCLQEVVQTVKPFAIQLDGFGYFDSGVIFVKGEPNTDLQSLYEKIREMLIKQMKFREDETGKKLTPHITLEKKLGRKDFSDGWKRIKGREFKATFTVNAISLMKHDGRMWKEFAGFQM